MTYLDKDQVLAALKAELESRILSCRRQYCSSTKMCVRHEGFSDAVQLLAALPAIPLDREAQSLIEKELRRANTHVEDTKQRGEAEMFARWVNYADGLQFALEKLASVPVLETTEDDCDHTFRVQIDREDFETLDYGIDGHCRFCPNCGTALEAK